jgi:hypothetical protein
MTPEEALPTILRVNSFTAQTRVEKRVTMNKSELQGAGGTAVAIRRALDASALLGEWSNTNNSATGIVRLVLSQTGNEVVVRVFGAGRAEPFDWGEAPAELFADLPGLMQATSFTSFHDLGFMSVWLLTYVVKGVLVVVSFTRFQDGSDRSNYFGKEFFYRSREAAAVQ